MPEGSDGGSLGALASVAKLLLENLWKLGLLLSFFCGLTLLGPRYGIEANPTIKTWAPTGLVLGVSCVSASIILLAVEGVKKIYGAALKRLTISKRRKVEGDQAVKNLQTLNDQELLALYVLFSSDKEVHQVVTLSLAFGLVNKKSLIAKDYIGGSALCEFEPQVLALKVEMLPKLEKLIEGNQHQFSGNPFASYNYL